MLSDVGAKMLTNRRMARAPIWLYRLKMGWLLGPRILLLEHRGRKTGESRFVCLEVVDRPAPGQLVIVSGLGKKSQWYQNLQSDQRCFVSSGRLRRVPAHAEFLSAGEAQQVLATYQQQHPRDWAVLHDVIEKATGKPVGDLPTVLLHIQ
ncbi:nitroreductase family deazaflavin-dependent oxidoreductase [Timonella sp. A28]|uniref:nitroreductase family deazaflavin-dependent oxidoreductase n=1 Tax=Timonella sp. A28 TaxID=3442640 RepID=UPI003EBD4C7A